ncbi:MAG: crossover junction endodeoxyribonuclease RuvC [Proteobacteria bacterium]|nr:crossover junction endodeoxyribonuclease RuvC [Pseudomonadota bacterium]
MRVLGVDPGSTVTGFGLVDRTDGTIRHVAHGTLRPPRTAALADRLAFVYDGIAQVARQHAPDAAVVEQVFFANSARSALVLGQARGVALAALAAASLRVGEVSAREVKKAVVGTGAASKLQVQRMVARLLGLDTIPASDAADALAAAIHQARSFGRPGRPRRGRARRSTRRPSISRVLGRSL